ncbi:hypothetical protein H6784_01380 [Candidatus Nomurabacteria bacterium]|nr:hypothetical protein [Candidatus Kaiserbacteria bacterium]MCB9814046.1 hypothetical protein [Candidatus Nomurabacteria bacterium]
MFGIVVLGFGIVLLVPNVMVLFLVVTIGVLSLIAVSAISSVLNAIFKVALYEYASTGRVPEGFSPEIVQNAVRK